MADRPDWMTPADERILAYLREVELAAPAEVADAEGAGSSSGHVGRRIRTLEDHGLTEYLGDEVYRITRKGKAYLDGELDDDALS